MPFDPCYHLVCDNIDNISWEALTINAKAAARAAAILANDDLSSIPPRAKTSSARRSVAAIRSEFQRWSAIAEEAEHGHSCAGHGDKNVV